MPDKQQLEQRHPLYTQFQTEWQLYEDSYVGGSQYLAHAIGRHLFPHFREHSDNYLDRAARAVYPNYSQKVIDIYAAFIFNGGIIRTSDDPDFKAFEENADRAGTPLSQVMKEDVMVNASSIGHVVAVVDLPTPDRTPTTKLDDIRLGMRPYLTIYTPLDVVDWSLDRFGNYQFLRVREESPDISDPFQKRDDAKYVYRTWTQDAWFTHDENGALLSSGTHKLGEVPAVMIPVRRHPKLSGIGLSLLSDIAPLNRRIFNYESLLDEFLYRQCFNFMAFPITDKVTEEQVKNYLKEAGTTNGFYYDGNGAPPSYISPPTPPAEVLMTKIEKASIQIIELAKLQDRQSGSSDKSGIAWMYEFNESNSAFGQIAENLEDGERRIIALFYKWLGREVAAEVEYPDDFNIRSLNDEIEETISLLTLDISETFNKELKRRIVKKALPSISDQQESEITDQIDEGSEAPELETEMSATKSAMDGATEKDTEEADTESEDTQAPTTDVTMASSQNVNVTQDAVLNGAQIQAATSIVTSVSNGDIPRDSGLGQLEVLFNLTRQQADAIMGSSGNAHIPTTPNPRPDEQASTPQRTTSKQTGTGA